MSPTGCNRLLRARRDADGTSWHLRDVALGKRTTNVQGSTAAQALTSLQAAAGREARRERRLRV